MTEKTIPRSCTEILELTIRHLGKKNEAKRVFLLWPNLKLASLRLCAFLSPFLLQDERVILDIALDRAIEAAAKETGSNQVKAFVAGVFSVVKDLCAIQVSVQDADDNWVIWDFEEPIIELMHAHRRDRVQVRPRDPAFEEGPVGVALLSRVFTIRDLMLAEFPTEMKA